MSKPTDPNKTVITVVMDVETAALLEGLARQKDRSMSSTVRQLVRDAAQPSVPSNLPVGTLLEVVEPRKASAPGVGR